MEVRTCVSYLLLVLPDPFSAPSSIVHPWQSPCSMLMVPQSYGFQVSLDKQTWVRKDREITGVAVSCMLLEGWPKVILPVIASALHITLSFWVLKPSVSFISSGDGLIRALPLSAQVWVQPHPVHSPVNKEYQWWLLHRRVCNLCCCGWFVSATAMGWADCRIWEDKGLEVSQKMEELCEPGCHSPNKVSQQIYQSVHERQQRLTWVWSPAVFMETSSVGNPWLTVLEISIQDSHVDT